MLKETSMSKRLLALVVPAALLALAVSAQNPTGPTFDVVSIRAAAPPDPAAVAAGKLHVGMTIDGARVDIGFLSLADLIPIAYRVKNYQVSGPDWMSSLRFDIQATLPEGATREQVPEMLQAMLADRFKMAAHRESKEHSVYALVVGKSGSKLKDAPPDADAPSATDAAAPGAPGAAIASGSRPQVSFQRDGQGAVVRGIGAGTMRMTMNNGLMHLEASKLNMASFVDVLSRFLDRPVVDMTDLKGNYQVSLDLSMEDLMKVARTAGVAIPAGGRGGLAGSDPGAAAAGKSADAASDPSGGSIFNSVQQLGLKLEPRKAPIDAIVIDHLEKNPTEN